MRKTLALILAIVMITSLFAAQVSADDAKPYDGVTITVISGNNGQIMTAQENIEEFTASTGIKVNFELYTTEELLTKINMQMAAGGSGLDVICYRPIQDTQAWYDNGYFYPLNDFIAEAGEEFVYEDFFPAARQVTTVSDGNIVGIPFLTEGEIMWYNKALFEEYGVEVPKTFNELMEVAQKLYDPDNNVYAISLRGEGNSAVTQFSGFLYGFGGDFYDENYVATMNTPEALAALEYYADLVKLGPDGAETQTTQDGRNWFNACVTAMRIDAYAQNWSHANPETSEVAEVLGYADFPEGPIGKSTPYDIVAYACAIASTSASPGASWEFIKWFTGKELDCKAMFNDGFSARLSTWASPSVEEAIDPDLMKVINKVGAIGYPYDRPHNINATKVRAIVGQMIDLAMTGLKGDELFAAVNPLNDQIQEILDSEK